MDFALPKQRICICYARDLIRINHKFIGVYMKRLLIALSCLSLLLVAATAQANLINNGTFDNNLDGWKTSIHSLVWSDDGTALFGQRTIDNIYRLTQNFTVDPGTTALNISFQLSFEGADTRPSAFDRFNVAVSRPDAPTDYQAIWSYPELFASAFAWNSDYDAYTTYDISTTVDLGSLLDNNSTLTLVFQLHHVYGGPDLQTRVKLDNVVVTAAANAVPVPAAVWLLGSGVAGVAALRRKMA